MPIVTKPALRLTRQELTEFFQTKRTVILEQLANANIATNENITNLTNANVDTMSLPNFSSLLAKLPDNKFVNLVKEDVKLIQEEQENVIWNSKQVVALFNFLARENSLTPQEVQRHMNDIFWGKEDAFLWQEIKNDLEQQIPDLEERRKFINQLWMKGYFWLPDQPFTYQDFIAKKNTLVWFNKFAPGCLSEWLKSRSPLAKEILNDSIFPSLLTAEALVKHEKRKNLGLLKALKPDEFFKALEKTTRLNKNDTSTIRAAIASASRSVGFVEFYGDPKHGLSRQAEVEKYFHSPALRKKLFEERLLKNVTFDVLSQNSDLLLWVAKMAPEWMRGELAQAANGNVDYFEDPLRRRLFKACCLTPSERDLFIQALFRAATNLIPLVNNLELLTWYTKISPLSTEEIIATRGLEFITREAVVQHLDKQKIDETGAVSAGLKVLLIYLLKCKDVNQKIDFEFVRENIEKIQALIIGNDRKDIAEVLVLLMVNPLAFEAQSEEEIQRRVASLMQGRTSSTRVIKQDSVFQKILGSLNDFMFIDTSVFSGIVGEHLCLALAQAELKDRVGYCFIVMSNPAMHEFLLPDQMKTFVSYGSDPNKLAEELLQTRGLSLSVGKCLALGEILLPNKSRKDVAIFLLDKDKSKWLVLDDESIQRELRNIAKPPKPPKAMAALRLATPEQIRDPKYTLNNLDIQTILEKYFKEKEIPVNVHAPIVWKNAAQLEPILSEPGFGDKPFVMPIKMKEGSWFGLAVIPNPTYPDRYTVRILNPLGNVLSTNLGANSDDIHLETHAKILLQKDGSLFLKNVVLPIVEAIGKVSYSNGDFNVATVMHKPQDNVDPKNPVFTMGNLMAVVNGGNKNITRLDPDLVDDVKLRETYAKLIAPKVKASVVKDSLVEPKESAPLPPVDGWYSPEMMQNILHVETKATVQPLSCCLPIPESSFQLAFADIVKKAFLDSQSIPRIIPINISNEEGRPYWIGVALYRSDSGEFAIVFCDSINWNNKEEYQTLSAALVNTANILAEKNDIVLFEPYVIKNPAEELIDSGPLVVEMLRRLFVDSKEAYPSVYELRLKHGQYPQPKMQVEVQAEKHEVEEVKEETQQERPEQQKEIIEEIKIDGDEVIFFEVPAPVLQELQEAVLVEKNEEKNNQMEVEENKPTAFQSELLSRAGLLKKPVQKTDEKKVVGDQEEKSLFAVLTMALDQRRGSIYQGGDDNVSSENDENEDDYWDSAPSSPLLSPRKK